MAAADLYTQGTQVWIPDCLEVWKSAELTKSYQEGDCILCLRLEDGSESAYPIDPQHPQLPFLCNPDYLAGENDLVALSYLHEPAVLHALRARFLETNTIYTYCGIILIAINPYQQLPIYEEPVIYAYSGQNVGSMDPHIFAVAEEAYKQMSRNHENQSLIISGESGAGKTASAKHAMRYFAAVGGSLSNTSMEEKVLASSPIMEAFGNAKTTRNDNSSRFGKYMEIGFSREYCIVGAVVKTYLLEKSRITTQAKAERNYHIFHQLCASADLPEFQGLGLSGAESFHYTSQGRCLHLDATDAANLESTRNAFSLLGIHESNQLELFSILASILHLGNIRLKSKDRHGESCFTEPDDQALALFCTLLGIEKSQAARWLCYRKLVTASETYVKPMSRQQALNSRDALAKHLYGQLFKWIVSRINKALRASCRQHTSIGILDIYGFEKFNINSFEQFCINYANEKLQHHFNLHVFKLEQEEYMKEGIPWTLIDFCDNQPCIDLIEAKLGILDLLNEECKMPKGSDTSWAQKLYDRHLHHSSYFQKPKTSMSAFIVHHFAGKVEYQCSGFLEKNQDIVHAELIGLLRASKSVLLMELFPDEGDGRLALSSRRSRGSRVTVHPSRRSLPAADKENRKSIATQFKTSLHQLMETLSCTTPHYIRCIKPNDHKQPFTFDAKRVVEQLRACGILETIQISASGYPSRWTYAEFFSRYRALMYPEELGGADEKQTCCLVLERLLKDPSRYQCGKGKIFFRAGQVAFLEELHSRRLRAACILIQKSLRCWLKRRRFLRVRAAAVCLQCFTRGFLARRLARHLRRTSAAISLQKNFKMAMARHSYQRTRSAALTIQAFARGMFARRLHRQMVASQKAVVIQSAVRGWLARTKYAQVRRAVIYLQCCYRRMWARRELRRLRVEAKSVEHYKQLHKGMEIKVMQLQCKVDEQAREIRSLSEQLSSVRASHCEEVEQLRSKLQRLQDNKVQETRIWELQEELRHVELQKSSLEGKLGQEIEELKQHLMELDILKSNLKEEKDALNQRIAELSQDLEDQMHQRVVMETQDLRCQLEGEQARYQELVKEYARLEQCFENLQDEVAFYKQTSSFRRSPSSDSILDSESSYQSSLSMALSQDDADQSGEFPSPQQNIGEILGLSKSPKKSAGEDTLMEEDLKYAYDGVQVSNKLLESQQQELEGLHVELHSLKQVIKQQQSIIQELQQHREEERLRLQHQIVQLKKNLDLSEQLEKETSMLRLWKQLKSNMNLTQDPTANREATWQGQKVTVETERPLEVPQPLRAFKGMLGYKAEDEACLIRTIITDFKPQHSPDTLPGLPAYILFMCFRHADATRDEHRIRSLFAATVSGIKRVVKKHSDSFSVVVLWLINTCCLVNCLRQYGRDQSYWLASTPKQKQQCLKNFDLASYCRSLDDLAIHIYQQLIHVAQEKLKPMIVAAMLESETIQGLSLARPPSSRRQPAAPAYTLDSLLQQLDSFHEVLRENQLEPVVMCQVFRQLLFVVSGVALNYLLLRKDTCSWSRGVQLRYNVSQLEEWLRAKGLQHSGAMEALEPLIQAAQLLQVKKTTDKDAEAICCLGTALSAPQIMKILRAYTPAARLEERITPSFLSSIENRLAARTSAGPCQLLVDTAHLFPVHLPFSWSPVQLDEICIPDNIDLSFLTQV